MNRRKFPKIGSAERVLSVTLFASDVWKRISGLGLSVVILLVIEIICSEGSGSYGFVRIVLGFGSKLLVVNLKRKDEKLRGKIGP